MSSSLYSSSFGFIDKEQYKNVYHRKVLTEKVIKNHSELDDELGWLYDNSDNLIWASSLSGSSWSSYSISIDCCNVDYIQEDKPHLKVAENVRVANSKKPPELIKKFGKAYSNKSFNKSFNKGFKSRQFYRKAF